MMRSGLRVAARSAVVAPVQARNSSLQVTVSGLNYVGTGMDMKTFVLVLVEKSL